MEAVASTSDVGVHRVESSTWTWVSTEEDEEELLAGGSMIGDGSFAYEEEDEDDDGLDLDHKKLIRTAPSIDWFDVEANEVSVVQNNEDEEFDLGRMMFLTLQMLAVAFGDIGISPLYTFDVMFSKYPIQREEEVLGALSLVLYTLISIPVLKYVLVVLWGNDDGEGGTVALYSLISRNAKISLIPNQHPSDVRMPSFQLQIPTPELERSIKVKQLLESSLLMKKLLLGLVLLGTSMAISDGVVTPAISVLSAVRGLKVGLPNLSQDYVVMISVALLIILFSAQRYATSKVGFALGPSLLVWFCCLGGIGIYNLSIYGPTVFKAFNPLYILYYFERNPLQAWLSLAGCILCASGSEAMFADLLYFPVGHIQLTFVLLVLPCLLLGYLGQAAFLIANQSTAEQIFFASLPRALFWPVFLIANITALIASRTMITAIFSCIKQAIALGCFPHLKIIHTSRKFMGQIFIGSVNWFLLVSCVAFLVLFGNINEIGNAYAIAELGVMMITTIFTTIIMLLIWQTNILGVLSFFVVFLGLELLFFCSALSSVGDGGWALLVFAAVILIIMIIWNYGSKLKYESEVKEKLSKDLLKKLGSNLGTIRAPGIGLVGSELVKGVPAVFGHLLTTLPAIHSMIVFVCVKTVQCPVVPLNERFLFQRVSARSYHMFRCIARYGYKDVRKEQHQVFEQLLIDGLEKFIHREAVELSLQSDDDIDSDEEQATASRIVAAPNGSLYSLDVPLLAEFMPTAKRPSQASTSTEAPRNEHPVDYAQNLELELAFIRQAKQHGAVYLIDNAIVKARKDSWFFKKLVINYFYSFLRNNCRRAITTMSIPHSHLLQVRVTYTV